MLFAPPSSVLAKQENRNHSRQSGLELAEDIDFQRREWTAQRLGWVLMGLLVLAAIAGLFGAGPLSNSSAERDGLRLEYDRFGRLQQSMSLRLHFSGDERESAAVFISRQYLASVQIENITPQPQRVESDVDWLIYSFLTRQRAGGATFHLKPEKFGLLSGQARLEQGEPISFRQFIYP
jgi:hypothetical protein